MYVYKEYKYFLLMQMISVYYVLPILEYKKILQICEAYVFNYKSATTKSQLLYFSYLNKEHSTKVDMQH